MVLGAQIGNGKEINSVSEFEGGGNKDIVGGSRVRE